MKILLFTLAAVVGANAAAAPAPPTPPTFKNGPYPPLNKVPDINSPQVVQWLSQINMSAIPNIPPNPADKGGPGLPKADPGSCLWTFNLCLGPTDISTCPAGYLGLTYDDGPTPFSVPLLDALLQTKTKATFFWIGSNIYQNPQIAQRVCNEGHQVAVHTWTHLPSTSLTNAQFVAEVKWTESIIKDVCGVTPKYFRPPFGDIDNRIRALLKEMGYTAVIWDIDSNDWQLAPIGTKTVADVDALFAQWIADNKKAANGHVLLEHDVYNASVVEAIKQLPNIQANWKPVPVASCVNDAHPYVETSITFPTIGGASNMPGANSSLNGTIAAGANATGAAASGAAASGAAVNASGGVPAVGPSKNSGSLISIAPLAVSFALILASMSLAL